MATNPYSSDAIKLNHVVPPKSWLPSWLSWRPTSPFLLYLSESRLLTRLNCQIESFFVPIFDSRYRIRTLLAKRCGLTSTASASFMHHCPIVMVHGMGAGVAMWVHNIDSLSNDRPVYSFDLLGFGRSSRPADMPPTLKNATSWWLSSSAAVDNKGDSSSKGVVRGEVDQKSDLLASMAEEQFVKSIEEWRQQLQIPRFILVGHSLGGYLAHAYAMRYPQRVAHLVLVDPWGFAELTPSNNNKSYGFTFRILRTILTAFNPLAVLRVSGPFGPSLIRRFRQDLGLAFNTVSETENENGDNGCIYDYIYHCNAQHPASGEAAFKVMNRSIGWAVRPMITRIHELPNHLPITFMYGGRSWMDPQSGHNMSFLRGNDAFTRVHVLDGAGHHVYAQASDQFNNLVKELSATVPDFTEEEYEQLVYFK